MDTKNINYVKSVVIIAIGAALYGFGGMIGIPVFSNTTLKPAMAILALFSMLWGPVVGFFVGFLGHWITDLMSGWGVWFSWVLGSGLVGAIMGTFPYITHHGVERGIFEKKEIIITVVMAFIANFFGYLVSVAIDYFFYAEPFVKAFTQQLIATVLNTIVIGILGSLLMLLVAKKFSSSISLSTDEDA